MQPDDDDDMDLMDENVYEDSEDLEEFERGIGHDDDGRQR